ncbi:complement C1q and tumor necrosis factor-related protein 9-like [Ambystoma mexicanum]|uniref:complement C1q and tumor necrosis factor-related protein 9-like n=1 Tax=Ambystoma mexicanum TaxID=8296 RepID=UPI0037E8AFAB
MRSRMLGGVALVLALCVAAGNAASGVTAALPVAAGNQAAVCQELINTNPNPASVPWDCLCYSCKGTKGSAGAKGDEGLQGTPGSPGLRGAKGSPGATGLQGQQGPRGFKGATGDDGSQGPPGPVGMRGVGGAKGDKGDPGNDGFPGTQGPPGLQGICPPCKGEKGIAGDMGPAGVPGLNGQVGLPGKNGLNGTKGDKGDVGPQGSNGAPGAKGDLGPQGVCNCKDGAPGAIGAPGAQGPQGLPGAMGPRGNPGVKGDQGLQGDKGSQGDQGFQGIPGPCTPHVQSSFSAYLTVSYPKSNLPVPFNKILNNPQNHFDATNSVYIAPTNGTYFFSYQLSVFGRVLVVGLFRNSRLVSRLANDANRAVASQSLVMRLSAGDSIWLQTKNDQSNGIYFDGNTDSIFSGYLIAPDVCDESGTRSLGLPTPAPTLPSSYTGWAGERESVFVPPHTPPAA